jgi:hypothetical protein
MRRTARLAIHSLIEGLRPSNSPTRALARRSAGSHPGARLAHAVRSLLTAASLLELPYSHPRSPLRRLASGREAPSRRSLAADCGFAGSRRYARSRCVIPDYVSAP